MEGNVRKRNKSRDGCNFFLLKPILRSDLVSDHTLEILGNQTKAKSIHHFGAEKPVQKNSHSSWNKKSTFQWLQGRKDILFYKAIKSLNLAVQMKK